MEKFEAMDTAVNMTSSANKAFGTTPSSYQPKYITDKHSYDKAKPKASYAYSNQTNQMELIPSTNG
jgi:hypothetical protein